MSLSAPWVFSYPLTALGLVLVQKGQRHEADSPCWEMGWNLLVDLHRAMFSSEWWKVQNSHPGVPRQDGNYYFCSYFAKDVARSARFGGSAAVSPCYVQSCWLHHQDTTGRLQAYKQHPALLGLAWHAVLGNYLCSHQPSCNGSKTEALDTIKKKKKRLLSQHVISVHSNSSYHSSSAAEIQSDKTWKTLPLLLCSNLDDSINFPRKNLGWNREVTVGSHQRAERHREM